MNLTKGQANVLKTCTCADRLKTETVSFWLVHNSFQIHLFIHHCFWVQHNSTKKIVV